MNGESTEDRRKCGCISHEFCGRYGCAKDVKPPVSQEPMRCAECDCEFGGVDCNWIMTRN